MMQGGGVSKFGARMRELECRMRRVEDLSPVQSLDMSLKFANGAGCVSRRSVAMSHGTKSTVSSGAKGAELRAHTRARTHTHAHSNGPFESRSALLISGTCVEEEGEQSNVKEGGTEGGGMPTRRSKK